MLFDVLTKKTSQPKVGWFVFFGLVIILAVKAIFLNPGAEQNTAWGDMIVVDSAAFFFQTIILMGALITVLLSIQKVNINNSPEYYAIMLISVIGMNLMAAANDLIMLYLAIETTSIPLYVLAGFNKKEESSVESGLKYLLFGAMTSAFMLYGFSFLYGFSGSTKLIAVAKMVASGSIPDGISLVVLLLVLIGFAFKISAVPFHFWAPDVYQGAPTPISGFLSTASKGAGFIVLMRFMLTVFAGNEQNWMLIAAILAAATMTLGNLLALVQRDLKRLLAYSSIAHAGYILIGVAAGNQLGIKAVMYYLLVYLFTNLAAFAIASTLEDSNGSAQLEDLKGLIKKSPWIAFSLLAVVLSLAGIPPFGGFVSKLLVLSAGVEAGLIWLVILAIINSVVGLYYYLGLIRLAFISEGNDQSLRTMLSWKVAMIICVVGIIILGVVYNPWFQSFGIASLNLHALN